MAPGRSVCILTDRAGKDEVVDIVVVKPDRTLIVNEKVTLTAMSRKPIREVVMERSDILRADPVADKDGKVDRVVIVAGARTEIFAIKGPTGISILGLRPGVVRMTITDSEGSQETMQIGVVPKK